MASPALRNVASQCRKVSFSSSNNQIKYTPYSPYLCRNHGNNIFDHADIALKIMCIGRNYMVCIFQTLTLLIHISPSQYGSPAD